jgi:hypothetical protein
MHRLKRALTYFVSLTFLILVLTVVLPANKAAMKEYHLGTLQYHILLFVLILPLVMIWFAAFYGYAKIKDYSSKIHSSAEGRDFNKLASGLMWLAWGLPIPTIIGLVLNSITNSHPGFHGSDIIIVNYTDLIIPFVAFSFISDASHGLMTHSRLQISNIARKCLVMTFVLLGVLYCFLTFRHLDLSHSGATSNPFYLPSWLVIVTITIPYLYIWFLGLLSGYELLVFGKHSKGLLYKKSLQILAAGVTAVIISSIALQYVTSIESRTAHLSLDTQLATSYVIRISDGLGYVLIAWGAIRLKRIEDV